MTDNSTTYTIVITGGPKNSKKITAQLSAPLPTGVTLKATFAAPSGWVSIPDVSLDATARDVVTGLDKTSGSTNAISYTLSATLAAGVVPAQSRTVTLTVVNAP